MSYGHGITTSKHGKDSTDVTSVVASRKFLFEDETEMQSGPFASD